MAALLDVNALLALLDSDHVSHSVMQNWFLRHLKRGWATCPLTENGFVRVLSQAAYPSGQRSPSEALQALSDLKSAFEENHEFWADDVTLTDHSLFDYTLIAGSKQVADVYLLGLTARHKGRLVSFDRSLTWKAVHGGTEKLVERPR